MNKLKKRNARRPGLTLLAAGVSAALGSTTGAYAQPAQVEEITVTGSRIVRRDLTASSPIVSIETTQLDHASGVGLETVLNQFPQFVPQDTQFDNSAETNAFATPGIATLNLRGIGANRTLVLIDGRRAQPANSTLVVDVNTIPAAAIERVETITGGASAVYGADALAGVVNFILRDDFEGVEVDARTGVTAEGDGEESRFSTLIGMNTPDGRGNLMLGLEWANRKRVMAMDRKFTRDGFFDPETVTGGLLMAAGYAAAGNNAPDQDVVDSLFPQVPAGTVPATSEFYFNPDGSVFVRSGGLGYNGPLHSTVIDGNGFTGMKFQPSGDLAQAFLEGQISSPLERISSFGRATFDPSDNLSVFVQASFSSVQVEQRGGYSPAITVWAAPVPHDGNRTLPTALQMLLDSRPDPTADWTLYRSLDFLGPVNPVNETDVYQVMAGIEGSLPGRDLTWEVYVSKGETDTLSVVDNVASHQRYQYLVAQPNFGEGRFAVGRYAMACDTGLPIFQPTPVADNCLEAIESRLKLVTDLSQEIVEANVQGRLANMPAGELRFALGAGRRRNDFSFDPDGINDNVSIVENPMYFFPSNNTAGSTEVSEIYGELLIPVTRRFDVELGYRYSDYNTAGGVDTYKALFNWRPTDSIAIRGGYQFATRAPNVAELFTGPSSQNVNFPIIDPCAYTTLAPWGNVPSNPRRLEVQALCRAIIGNDTSEFDTGPGGPDFHARPGNPFFMGEVAIVQGNPNLGPEEADTWTLGIVLNRENFTASFDLYSIEISDAIAPLNAVFVYSKCFNADGVSNPDLVLDDPGGWCRLIHRNPITGQRSEVDTPFFNTGLLETAGLDIALNWTIDVGRGSLYVNPLLSVLDRFETQESVEAPVFDAKGTLDKGGQFDYRLFTTVGYNLGRSSFGLTWRHLPSVKDESAAQNPNTTVLGVGSYDMFNVFANYAISDRVEIRGGIDNLLDEEPPIVGARPGIDARRGVTRPDYYDLLGRRYYVGIKVGF